MTVVSSPQATPPTPQEVTRKLSVTQKTTKARKKPAINITTSHPLSGTESDSDTYSQNQLSPDGSATFFPSSAVTPPPLSSIAEGAHGIEGESDGDEDEDEAEFEGGRKSVDRPRTGDESVVKAGYLWKKGVRRKAWKKRWFVLRPTQLAYYKDKSEYKLLRLLDLTEIHSITPCSLKRHDYTFGLVSPSRTFYLQASSQPELEEWVTLMRECREGVVGVETVRDEEPGSATPIPIPQVQTSREGGSSYGGQGSSPLSSRRSQSPTRYFTSSEDDDFSAGQQAPQARSVSTSASGMAIAVSAPVPSTATSAVLSNPAPAPITKAPQIISHSNQLPKEKDPSKPILSGYLMKSSSKSSPKRRSWKKRWFVLTGQRLYYCGSHMETKPHRDISLDHILDALEDDSITVGNSVGSPTHGHGVAHGHPMAGVGDETTVGEGGRGCVFKIVTTKRTLVLSAPSEAEEIKWLSTVRALIARRSGPGPGHVHVQSAHGSKAVGHSRNESSGH